MIAATLVAMTMAVQTLVAACSIEDEILQMVTIGSKLEYQRQIETLKTELKREAAWYSLHVAAAAACRGSTETGGSGRHANVVLAKENTQSCTDQCASTEYTICDADVAIHGSFGKATSYQENVGNYYNYGCGTPGNQNVRFDEVKAGNDDIFDLDVNEKYSFYYRFCCCRFP